MLERVSLFFNSGRHETAELEAIGQERSVPMNSLLIKEGDNRECLYIVLKGMAHALHSDVSGRRFIVNRYVPYEYFSEMSFFDLSALSNPDCLDKKPVYDFAAQNLF